jgi:iron complex transport system ATP-binding protein
MTELVIDNLSVPIGGRTILRDIGFAAQGGTLLGLVGPNGAGKSTLARAIAGLLAPSAGMIAVDGVPLSAMSRRNAARKIAYLPQGDAVHWPLAARATVALGRAPHLGRFGALSPADRDAIERAMARADLASLAERDVKSLSGGERARVLLARALAVEAPILVADEPVGALDPRHALRIMALLREEVASGVLVIAVLHDLALASRFCDRLIVLNDGRLVGDGPPHDVLSPPGLARYYRVSGHHGAHDAERFVIPWQALDEVSHPSHKGKTV